MGLWVYGSMGLWVYGSMGLVELTDEERQALAAAQHSVRRVRDWRRLQAVHLLGGGRDAAEVAAALDCSVSSSSYYWAEAWRTDGRAGLREGPHAGRARRLDASAEAEGGQLLAEDPQARGYAATDWTVPLLRTALAQHGHRLSERTLRRTLHRLG